MAKRCRYTQQQVIDALKATHGMVYIAARHLGCDPDTIMNYCKRFEAVEQAKRDARGAITDEVELRLLAAIRRDESWAISFYLRTIGRGRGYGDVVNLNVSIERAAHLVASQFGLTPEVVLAEARLLLEETDRGTC
jgi:hypothetical protein